MTRRKLIVSDVDNTLLGNDNDLVQFARWYQRHRRRVRLVYSSGRFYRSVVDSVRSTPLPDPDAIIGGVGTEMRLFPTGQPVFAWDDRLHNCWDPDQVRELLAGDDRLVPQPAEFQSACKLSYFFYDARAWEIDQIRDKLADASIDAELVYSSSRDLDVLPVGVNKGSAAKFLARHLGYKRNEVLVCGDSANDASMFKIGCRGIVVGNAHHELLALNDSRIYHSPACYAGGVLDGIDYWLRRDKDRARARRKQLAGAGS